VSRNSTGSSAEAFREPSAAAFRDSEGRGHVGHAAREGVDYNFFGKVVRPGAEPVVAAADGGAPLSCEPLSLSENSTRGSANRQNGAKGGQEYNFFGKVVRPVAEGGGGGGGGHGSRWQDDGGGIGGEYGEGLMSAVGGPPGGAVVPAYQVGHADHGIGGSVMAAGASGKLMQLTLGVGRCGCVVLTRGRGGVLEQWRPWQESWREQGMDRLGLRLGRMRGQTAMALTCTRHSWIGTQTFRKWVQWGSVGI
jgi:hypothetical protein